MPYLAHTPTGQLHDSPDVGGSVREDGVFGAGGAFGLGPPFPLVPAEGDDRLKSLDFADCLSLPSLTNGYRKDPSLLTEWWSKLSWEKFEERRSAWGIG